MAIINDSNLSKKNIIADVKTMCVALTIMLSLMGFVYTSAVLISRVTGIK